MGDAEHRLSGICFVQLPKDLQRPLCGFGEWLTTREPVLDRVFLEPFHRGWVGLTYPPSRTLPIGERGRVDLSSPGCSVEGSLLSRLPDLPLSSRRSGRRRRASRRRAP